MKIGKDYKIETDELNVTILKRSISKKTGKEYWTPFAYLSNLENALKYFADLKVKETGLTDLKTVIAKQAELYKLIENSLSKVAP